MAAPLIAGNDLSNMDEATKRILLNREVIAINQDPLGVQGRRVSKDGDKEVWVKPLSGGGRAVLLLNRGTQPVQIAVEWAQLDYPADLRAEIRDLWQHKVVGQGTGWSGSVDSHETKLFRLRKVSP